MKHILPLKNSIQEYAWGSTTAFAEVLGYPNPSCRPQAELWMGSHPKAPSRAWFQGQWHSLRKLIQQYPSEILGPTALARFGPELPFLFKVLAAARPLSLQAHPDKRQAALGFNRENEWDIPMDADHRNYKDGMSKPEILCAWTPFWVLSGFRDPTSILERCSRLDISRLNKLLNPLHRHPEELGLRRFFENLMGLDRKEQSDLVHQVLQALTSSHLDNDSCQWIRRLDETYPSDIGSISPLFLHLVHLDPGQAIFTPAGVLHAYLEGVGVELMGNSDNVLRGGCTSKHVDVEELLQILHFREIFPRVCCATEIHPNERIFKTPAREFALSSLHMSKHLPYQSVGGNSPEILLCTQSEALWIKDLESNASLEARRGDSFLIPAAVPGYRIHGEGVFYRARIPVSES